MRVLTEAPLGGPAIKADSKHLNATLNFTLRLGGLELCPGILDLWVTLFDGGPDPRQHNQVRDAQSGTTAVAGLSRDWGHTHSSVASNWSANHEPRASNRECATTTWY